ncbi:MULTISPECIES: hypothetical protein [Rhodococcus]|uniref:Uncharacterized protein n=1 Tax=Rhodococcus aetherivorans TaxID=191292 RepID=A0AA46NT73_9NOCA|nr:MULTISPECIES: hypothetical protein [Rhodococcus]UGQ43973.1 hypothetical protein LRQ66_12230 [Rhodococcus aetherivorans]UYF92054.1 hypothetical protein OCS65_16205 [Rhodococcus aetherivorans]WKX01199.1 hypothetical protein Q3O43_13285 [Rhodococcus aetherivorans]
MHGSLAQRDDRRPRHRKAHTDLLPVQTAADAITATVTIDGASITLQSGAPTWHAA